MYVRAQIGVDGETIQAHMALSYIPNADEQPLILDNLITQIRPIDKRADLKPVFSFNSTGLWIELVNKSAGDPMARIGQLENLVK